ncbi:MAG: hypothetical protein ACLT0Y_00585 [Christensenellales bacterium]
MKQTQQPIWDCQHQARKPGRTAQFVWRFSFAAIQEKGMAILCDGMGGMAEGGMIAAQNLFTDAENIPVGRNRRGAGWICRQSQVYRQFRGQGYALVAAFIKTGAPVLVWGDGVVFVEKQTLCSELAAGI